MPSESQIEVAGVIPIDWCRTRANSSLKSRLEPEVRQAGMIVRTTTERPEVLALGLADGQVVDARKAAPHEPVAVEFPIFVSVRAEPVTAVVVPQFATRKESISTVTRFCFARSYPCERGSPVSVITDAARGHGIEAMRSSHLESRTCGGVR